jgi:hypothetical protein
MSNAISSQVSAVGPSRFALSASPIMREYGQALVHANLSPRLAKVAGLLTSGTYGPHGFISSKSAALASSLANRLRAKTASRGTTLYKLTLKERVTPASRAIFAVRGSARRTSDSGCTGWPSPMAGTPGAEWQQRSGEQRLVAADSSARDGLAHHHQPGPQGRGGTERGEHDAHGQTTARLANGGVEIDEGERQRRVGARDGEPSAVGLAVHVRSGADTVLGMEHATGHRWEQRWPESSERGTLGGCGDVWAGPLHGPWLYGRDGYGRPVEAGTFPLANGVPNRVGLLRGYGNAINPWVAAEFLESALAAAAEIT